MNSATVKLTICDGRPEDQVIAFDEPTTVSVGRALDCDIALPADYAHSNISRHHCQFEIDPPMVRVRDLGSRNGTVVNGRFLGQNSAAKDQSSAASIRELKDGDEVRVGITYIHVEVKERAGLPAAEMAYCI